MSDKEPPPPTSDNDEDFPEYVRITDVLDLHGFFPEQIPEVIQAFIEQAVELGLRELQIIHGKGKSKLKYLVRKELTRYPAVTEVRDAPPDLGGWGRTIVYLEATKR